MFTLTVYDEQVYRALLERVEHRGESLDQVLRELLEREAELGQTGRETPARQLLRLIDDTELSFDHPFNARDAEELLRHETGNISWPTSKDHDGSDENSGR